MDDDVFGQEIWGHYNKKPVFQVVDREDGYINVDNELESYFYSYKNWEKHEKEAIKYAKGRCLDIGCGAGRACLYLQSKGQYALGIDTSPLAIKTCKLRGVKNVKVMGIEDIERLKNNYQLFDSILLFGYNFGLFESKAKARKLLDKMYKITSKDGRIIAESRDPYLTDNPFHFKYHEMNRRRGRMPGQLRIRIRFMQYATKWFDYLYVSKKEMKDLLKGTGWKVERFINAQGYKKNGTYIAIIRKIFK